MHSLRKRGSPTGAQAKCAAIRGSTRTLDRAMDIVDGKITVRILRSCTLRRENVRFITWHLQHRRHQGTTEFVRTEAGVTLPFSSSTITTKTPSMYNHARVSGWGAPRKHRLGSWRPYPSQRLSRHTSMVSSPEALRRNSPQTEWRSNPVIADAASLHQEAKGTPKDVRTLSRVRISRQTRRLLPWQPTPLST